MLRIKLRYDDVEAMISRFAPNVGKSGLFLPTKSLQPVGAEVKFELRLATDTPVLLGLGRVKLTKAPDPEQPKASFGMAIELMRVTRESRDLILRMLERRKQLGLPEVGIPMPADLDAARRQDFVDTAVRDAASAPVPAAVSAVDSGPAEASTGLLTAPRRASGPLAVQKAVEIEPLPPEPPRKKRPGLSELIERASGPIAAVTVPGLDEDVDVAAVVARARALAAGGDLDSELEALVDSQAAPIEIGIEAASAELARQLGGVAVRRGASAPTSWAPPPAVVDLKADEGGEAKLDAASSDQAKLDAAKVEEASSGEAKLDDAQVRDGNLDAASADASSDEAKLDGAQQRDGNLDAASADASSDEAKLDAAKLDGARLRDGDLDAVSADASSDAAKLDAAKLDGAQLRDGNLDAASADASSDEAKLDAAQVEEAGEARVGEREADDSRLDAQLDGAQLDGAQLDGAKLAGAGADAAQVDEARLDALGDDRRPAAPEAADTYADPDAAVAALDAADDGFGEEHEVDPEQIDDEIHQLGESDFEEVEHTQIGQLAAAFDDHAFATTPAMQSELAEKLDAHLAEVESAGEHDDLGIGEASGHYLRSKIGLPPAEIYEGEPAEAAPPPAQNPLPPEYQQDFIHRFDAMDRAGYEPVANDYAEEPHAAYQDPAYPQPDPYSDGFSDELPPGAQSFTNETGLPAYAGEPQGEVAYAGEAIDAYGNAMPQPTDELEPEEIEEIDDFEILAEADEADADLLTSSGESELSARHEAATVDPELSLPPPADGDFELPPPRESDFAMRLDLGDDDSGFSVPAPMDPLAASAGHALAGFSEEEDPSHSFTFAEQPAPGADEDSYAPGFIPPGRFDQSDVIPIAQPRTARQTRRPTAAPATPPFRIDGPPPNVGWDEVSNRNEWAKAPVPAYPSSEEIDLESALEALDVDLDDLSTSGAPVPHAPTELARAGSTAGRATIRPPSQGQDPKRKSTRIPRGRAPRANTDDGVLIDFDDDDE